MDATNATATWSVRPLAGARIPNTRPQPTWAEWSKALSQRGALRRRTGDALFSDRELAHLEFLRWLYQTGQPESAAGAEPGGR